MHLLISNPCILIVTESRFTEVKLLLTGLPITFLLALAFNDTVNPQNTLRYSKKKQGYTTCNLSPITDLQIKSINIYRELPNLSYYDRDNCIPEVKMQLDQPQPLFNI